MSNVKKQLFFLKNWTKNKSNMSVVCLQIISDV